LIQQNSATGDYKGIITEIENITQRIQEIEEEQKPLLEIEKSQQLQSV